jgi:hypothetical protein
MLLQEKWSRCQSVRLQVRLKAIGALRHRAVNSYCRMLGTPAMTADPLMALGIHRRFAAVIIYEPAPTLAA